MVWLQDVIWCCLVSSKVEFISDLFGGVYSPFLFLQRLDPVPFWNWSLDEMEQCFPSCLSFGSHIWNCLGWNFVRLHIVGSDMFNLVLLIVFWSWLRDGRKSWGSESFNLFAELTLRWCDISLADPDNKNTVQVRLGVFSSRRLYSWDSFLGYWVRGFFFSLFQLHRTVDILLLIFPSIFILLLVSSSSTYYPAFDRVSWNAGAG